MEEEGEDDYLDIIENAISRSQKRISKQLVQDFNSFKAAGHWGGN
jgi:hypothetical protein